MKVGQLTETGLRAMTPRTKAKLAENADNLMAFLGRMSGEQYPSDEDCAAAMRKVVDNALVWTADDVLAQAVADGYVSEQEGVV